MDRFSNGRVFFAAIAIGMAAVVGVTGYKHWRVSAATDQLRSAASIKDLTERISVSEQLRLDQLPALQASGFHTIIDLRPDGEAVGQPDAASMAAAAKANRLAFVYVPVQHGDIPDSAVQALATAIGESRGPILLYCRSGRRAARTWSLVEASRANGMDAEQILAAVKASGQSADDLRGAIGIRIAERVAKPKAVQ